MKSDSSFYETLLLGISKMVSEAKWAFQEEVEN